MLQTPKVSGYKLYELLVRQSIDYQHHHPPRDWRTMKAIPSLSLSHSLPSNMESFYFGLYLCSSGEGRRRKPQWPREIIALLPFKFSAIKLCSCSCKEAAGETITHPLKSQSHGIDDRINPNHRMPINRFTRIPSKNP